MKCTSKHFSSFDITETDLLTNFSLIIHKNAIYLKWVWYSCVAKLVIIFFSYWLRMSHKSYNIRK